MTQPATTSIAPHAATARAGGIKERPILFSAPMIPPILADIKTQTRRLIKPVGNDEGFVVQDYGDGFWPYRSEDGESGFYRDRHGYDMEERIKCPYGQPGDRLWVREGHALDGRRVFYRVGHVEDEGLGPRVDVRWRPSIHMPRWASRITLEVTDVKVERLQDISEADALAEGIAYGPTCDEEGRSGGFHWDRTREDETVWPSAVAAYRALWESINGTGSWDANPHVWCISFRRIHAS